MSANTETTGADGTKCKAPAWCDFDDNDEGDPRVRVYIGTRDGIYGVVSTDGRRYCTPACRDARLPPIAAPAAHVERRKGQRWSCDSVGFGTVVGTLIDLRDHHWSVRRDDGSPDVWIESRWKISGFIMTLLADATPEPVKPVELPSGTLACHGIAQPGSHVSCHQRGGCEYVLPASGGLRGYYARCGFSGATTRTVLEAVRSHEATCPKCLAKSPPAQEAPKAAPVCSDCYLSPALLRHLRRVPRTLCDDCYSSRERSIYFICANPMGTRGNESYAGPERLPRPQLAADWVEDCLPTVWR